MEPQTEKQKAPPPVTKKHHFPMVEEQQTTKNRGDTNFPGFTSPAPGKPVYASRSRTISDTPSLRRVALFSPGQKDPRRGRHRPPTLPPRSPCFRGQAHGTNRGRDRPRTCPSTNLEESVSRSYLGFELRREGEQEDFATVTAEGIRRDSRLS